MASLLPCFSAIALCLLLLQPCLASKKTYIVHMKHHVKPSSFLTHQQWYAAILQSLSSSDSLLYTYNTAYHGFAAFLEPQEAQLLRQSDAVLGVYEDTVYPWHGRPQELNQANHPKGHCNKKLKAVVGDNLKLIRRKMIATVKHASPTSPRNIRKLLRTSSEHEDRRRQPSPATTKNSNFDGITSDDLTKKKEGIWCSGGKHNDGEYGVVASRRCRGRRRLITASPSDSQPAPGYRR